MRENEHERHFDRENGEHPHFTLVSQKALESDSVIAIGPYHSEEEARERLAHLWKPERWEICVLFLDNPLVRRVGK